MNNNTTNPQNTERRDFLKVAGASAVATAVLPMAANATPQAASDAIAKAFPGKTLMEGRIEMVLPEIAENGGTVPVSVSVESPMQPDDYVKSVHIFSEGNPMADVAAYYFSPNNGKADMSLRIRMLQSQTVIAVAEMSNGDVYKQSKQIKVTLGGCGG